MGSLHCLILSVGQAKLDVCFTLPTTENRFESGAAAAFRSSDLTDVEARNVFDDHDRAHDGGDPISSGNHGWGAETA